MSRLYPCMYCTEDGYCKKYSDEEVVSWCVQGPCKDEKPTTNADRIRAMTDEELAAWLSDMHDAVTCPNGGAIDCNPSCKRCWLDWLKEGVDDE